VRMQHSIIDTVVPVLHTPHGAVVYVNDFKLDRTPVIGDPPDFARYRQIGKEGVLAMIVESTNIEMNGRTPSERIARDLVRDTITSYEDDKNGIMVSTFSSHIARIKTIAECAHEIGRKPILIGRSMERYSATAEQMKLVAFPSSVSMVGNRKSIDRTFRRIMKAGKEHFLPIVTGHQGEPGSILSRIVQEDTSYKIDRGDKIIFSAKIIPNPMNYGQRYLVETRLKMKGARIFDDLHVSGHAYREDHYEMINLLNPEHIIPSHGGLSHTGAYASFAADLGYSLHNDLHLLSNGQRVTIKK